MIDVKALYNYWLNNVNEDLKEQLLNYSEDEIKESFYKNLEFGTAGMRGVLGPGTNKLNIYIIKKATLGFGRYLLKRYKNLAKTRGLVIGYDNRFYSEEFSIAAANVLASLGIKVYRFESLRPTPEVSFAIRHFHACGGIIITASHNPKEYNGYKIYDETGAQILPLYVEQIIEEINKIDDIFNIEDTKNLELVTLIGKDIDKIYLENIKTISINKNVLKDNSLFVYTPLHGTGSVFASKFLRDLGYKVVDVLDQMTSDPNFSNVKSANPEEKIAYSEAIDIAKKLKADCILATDPDADRLGVVVLHNNEYIYLNGNETASIILDYLTKFKKIKKDSYVLSSIVSSSLPRKIAKSNNLNTITVLTGFKYIGEKCTMLENNNLNYYFGFEESYGCLIKDFVRDKDAIQAITMLAEITCYYKQMNKTLIDVLYEIYEKYGYYKEFTQSINFKGIDGNTKMNSVLSYFRSNDIKLKTINITDKIDYLKDTDLPKTNMIKFSDDLDNWFILRPSGTEPKLKIYYGINSNSLEKSNQLLNNLIEEVKEILNTIE